MKCVDILKVVFFFIRSIKQFPANLTNNEPVFNVSIPLLYFRKPKIEKVKKVVEAEQTEETTKKNKKKGFLPETKKRKNRNKPTVLEGKEMSASTKTPEGASGEEGKKKNKKRKQQGGEEETQNQTATKKAKTQQQLNKKKKKGGQQKADGK